jgi:acetyl-CoA decarbonylase/synthase complex subunit gamma
VRSTDLPSFLDDGLKASLEMRRVRFPLGDRLVLVPLEIVQSGKYVLPAAVLLLILSGLSPDGYAIDRVWSAGFPNVVLLCVAWLAGTFLSPAFLPWIPARAFSLKGALIGFAAVTILMALDASGVPVFTGFREAAGWSLIIPTVSSVLAMNFTGSSTYTSLSGVKREMRFAVPVQITAGVIGFVLWIAGRFVQ